MYAALARFPSIHRLACDVGELLYRGQGPNDHQDYRSPSPNTSRAVPCNLIYLKYRTPKDHINTRILHNIVSGIPLYWALEPAREILMFMWSFRPLKYYIT